MGKSSADACRCALPARGALLSLSVDGTEKGVFVSGLSTHAGDLWVDPSGRSVARVSADDLVFDTQLSLATTTFKLVGPVAPVGDILYLERQSRLRITGGTAEKLELLPFDARVELEWVIPPTLALSCDELRNPAPLKLASAPAAPRQRFVVQRGSSSGVRASERAPVVAKLRVPEAAVLDERAGLLQIRARTAMGDLVGWVDANEWESPKPESKSAANGGGLGRGSLGPTYSFCALGSPLYVLHEAHLYRVGRLRAADDPVSGAQEERARLRDPAPTTEIRFDTWAASPGEGYLSLRDPLLLPNGRGGPVGQLMVDSSACHK